MGVAHVGLVHRDPCECKVKGFSAVSSIEWNISYRGHLQGVQQTITMLRMACPIWMNMEYVMLRAPNEPKDLSLVEGLCSFKV